MKDVIKFLIGFIITFVFTYGSYYISNILFGPVLFGGSYIILIADLLTRWFCGSVIIFVIILTLVFCYKLGNEIMSLLNG